MNLEQRKDIISSQRDALKRHGYHPNALLWSNKEVQEIRFKIIAEIGIESGDSVFDIGCGFGDFSAYLTRIGTPVNFTGIDLSEELIIEGHNQYPSIEMIVADLFDYDPTSQSFDYVTLSGTLNRKFDNSTDYTFKTISRMYQTCKKGIAFNLLDARHEWTAGRWDLQSFYPDEVVKYVSQFADDYKIIDGYLENDFTVYVWR